MSSDSKSSSIQSQTTHNVGFNLLAYSASILIILAASIWVIIDNAQSISALNALTPALQPFIKLGSKISVNASALFPISFSIIFLLIIIKSIFEIVKNHSPESKVLCLICVLALLCQVVFSYRYEWLGLGILIFLVYYAFLRRSQIFKFSESLVINNEWTKLDTFALLIAVSIATIFRTYALNRITNTFEGELSPYMIGATNLKGILYANSAIDGPWAPLGILYYLPIYLFTLIDGISLLAVRLGSVLPSAITVALVYHVAKVIAGRRAGFIAAMFISIDNLQIGWGRTDVHPHGSTSWIGLLLILFLIKAFTEERTRNWWIVAALMALSWHQYPSGQIAMVIPFFALGIRFLLVSKGCSKSKNIRLIPIGVGALLWGLVPLTIEYFVANISNPLKYFIRLGPRIHAIGISDEPWYQIAGNSIWNASLHVRDLFEGVFVAAPYLFHQDILIDVPGIPIRTVSSVVAFTFLIGLCLLTARLKRPDAWVVLAAIAAATIPAAFAEYAYPKRSSFLFPLIFIVAGIGAHALLSILEDGRSKVTRILPNIIGLCWLTCSASLMCWLWFGGERQIYGEPPEIHLAQRISTNIEPHTIILAQFENHYFEGKLSYLLLPTLLQQKSSPLLWFILKSEPYTLGRVLEDPKRIIDALKSPPFYYLWSNLRDQTDKLRAATYEHLVFVIQKGEVGNQSIIKIKEAFPQSSEELIIPKDLPGQEFAIIRTQLK